MIFDIYSRAIVGVEMHGTDSADHAARLGKRSAALADGVHAAALKPVLHGDIKPSCFRQRVSDDNPYAGTSLYIAKYRPEVPVQGFTGLDAVQEWALRFVHRHNEVHSHSALLYVTPAQRHAGQDRALLAARHEITSKRATAMEQQPDPRLNTGGGGDTQPGAGHGGSGR